VWGQVLINEAAKDIGMTDVLAVPESRGMKVARAVDSYLLGEGIRKPQILIFKGESYEFWSIKMRTLFRSQELWELVENGIAETGRRESMKKNEKALFFIQQAVDEMIFSRIAAANSAKEAWDTLKMKYQGSANVITVKLQFLRRDFESAVMKGNETVQEYLARISSIVSQMRAYGDKVADEIVVAKILRSLSPNLIMSQESIEIWLKKTSTPFKFKGNMQGSHKIVAEEEAVLEEEVVVDRVLFSVPTARNMDIKRMIVGAKISKHNMRSKKKMNTSS
nr:UBN2 domain-containing protein [Tanacetum cinerariifolium]